MDEAAPLEFLEAGLGFGPHRRLHLLAVEHLTADRVLHFSCTNKKTWI